MPTVAQIAKRAMDAVQSAIPGSIQVATFGALTGRIVFDMTKAPSGFPSPDPKDRVETAYLEGFTAWPVEADEIVSSGVTYYILAVRDIVKAGGLYSVRLASADNLLWQTVDFERVTETPDGAGGRTRAWAGIAGATGIKIGIASISGGERFASDRVEETSKWRAVVPAITGLTAKDRVTFGGKSYGITFVDDREKRGKWMALDLMEGVAT